MTRVSDAQFARSSEVTKARLVVGDTTTWRRLRLPRNCMQLYSWRRVALRHHDLTNGPVHLGRVKSETLGWNGKAGP